MSKIIKPTAAIILFILLFASCTRAPSPSATPTEAPPPEPQILTMGTNAEFPPFEFVADNNRGLVGQFDGVDVALAKKIADEYGYEFAIENMAFDALIMALESGRIDFIAAGMTATDERRKTVDFTETYYKAVQYMIVKKDNNDIRSVNDLNGKIVGVQQGTTGDFIVSDDLYPYEVMRYSRGIEAVLDLKNDKIDAIVIDSMPATIFVNRNSDLKLVKAQSMVIRESSAVGITSIYNAYGRSVGVLSGSDGEIFVTVDIPDAAITAYDSLDAAAEGLRAAKVDILFLDGLVADAMIEAHDDFTFPENNDVYSSELFEAEEYAIAIKKGNDDLRSKMNAVIASMKENGEIDELVTRYSE